MTLADVNVLIAAHREDAVHHEACHAWLTSQVHGASPFGISQQVLGAVIRIETHPRVYNPPTPLANALGFVNLLMDLPHCRLIEPGREHWAIFSDLCRQSNAAGNLVQDAWYAALAIESGCTWITLDRDYARFKGLHWRGPV